MSAPRRSFREWRDPIDQPIIFKAEMVRQILAGLKSQTRRASGGFTPDYGDSDQNPLLDWPYIKNTHGHNEPLRPRFVVGDRLWVRETWRPVACGPDAGPSAWVSVHYKADDTVLSRPYFDCSLANQKFRSPLHMPRVASRITLRVLDVQPQRLWDISEEDAKAEGVEPLDSNLPESRTIDDFDFALCPRCGGRRLYTSGNPLTGGIQPDTDCRECDTHYKRFRWLWESIHGALSWNGNPWVWKISFRASCVSPDKR